MISIRTSTSRSGTGGRPRMGGRGPMRMMKGEKARDFKGTMRKLLGYLGQYRIALLIVAIMEVASSGRLVPRATTVRPTTAVLT